MMAEKKRKRLFVSPLEDKWVVQWENEDPLSVHENKQRAIEVAKEIIKNSEQDSLQIIIKRKDGSFQTEWNFN